MTTPTQELPRQASPASSGRRPWLIVVLLIVALIAGLLATVLVARRRPSALAQLRVRATNVDVGAGGKGLARGSEGQTLATGDVVQTDPSGQAQVDYFDGSLTRLDSNTRFVIQELKTGPNGRRISLDLKAGRTWNRVVRLTSSNDRYEVKMANAVATVRGTTFVVDCRRLPRCFVVGFDGTTLVRGDDGTEMEAGDGECVQINEDGTLEECDPHALHLTDEWTRQMKVEDALIGLPNPPTLSPSPSPTEEPAFVPRRRFVPTPTPRRTLPPLPTEDPNDTPRPSPSPSDTPIPTRTPKPSSPPPEPTPCETDCGEL